MNARSAADRLEVWTYEEAGETIPSGDPSVTDAERSAAGLETMAARWQALLPGNRSRAAAQYAAGGLPEGQDVVRVLAGAPVSPTAPAGRSPLRNAVRTCSARWPRSAPAWSRGGSAARPVRLKIRHYLAAGTLEPGFRRATRQWAERLQRSGLPCRHEEWIGGHDHLWWEHQFPVALGWLLTPS
jgi:hypothetical protein